MKEKKDAEFGRSYIYVTQSPVAISSLKLPDAAEQPGTLRSVYILSEEIHEFLRNYAKGIVNIEMPKFHKDISVIDKPTAMKIGKALTTQEDEFESNSTVQKRIQHLTGMDKDMVEKRYIWNLKAVFIEGDGIEVQGWINRNPIRGWGFLASDLLQRIRRQALESFDPEFSRL